MVRSLPSVLRVHGISWAVYIFLTSLGLTVASWYATKTATEARAQAQFDFTTNDIASTVADRLQDYQQTLWGGAGLFAAVPTTTLQQWITYVEGLKIQGRLPGIQGVAFAKVILPSDKDAHIREVRTAGVFGDYDIRPQGEREQYTSIIYHAPLDWRNRRAIGFDMLTEPVRREAMERTRDTGQIAVSGRVTLVQETSTDVQAGFLMFLAVYRNGAPLASIDERRRALIGWVATPFRMKDLMGKVLEHKSPDIAVEIYDGSSMRDDELLFRSNEIQSPTNAGSAPAIVSIAERSIGDRPWTLRFKALPTYNVGVGNTAPLIILFSGIIISLLAGFVVGTIILKRAHDISANKHLQDANRRLERQSSELATTMTKLTVALKSAENANRSKSAFFANVSHELRTPLNAILGYTQLFKREQNLSKWQAGAVNTIERSGEHLLTLISDILDLSKIEAVKLELSPSIIDLSGFIDNIVNIINVRANEKGISFVKDIPTDLPRFVRADDTRLRQVLLNLLGNAVKFTDQGQVQLRVDALSKSETKAELRFEVKDTGVGIAEDKFKTLFKPFEQVGDPQRRHDGTGLGLSISQELVRLMASEIKVESQTGEGSRFWFDVSLPVAEAGPASMPDATNVTGYLGPRRSVLIVDDMPENRAVLVDTLGCVGFEIHQASNGLEGLERAQAVRQDLILMDVMMPVMDGLEATRRIREIADLQSVPIIAVSASIAAEDQNRCLAAGANAFLAKPIDHRQLFYELGRLLHLSWVETPLQPAASTDVGVDRFATPPLAEITILYELARTGNMRKIISRADQLGALDAQYRPFVDRLRQLARDYNSKAILRLVEELLQQQQPAA